MVYVVPVQTRSCSRFVGRPSLGPLLLEGIPWSMRLGRTCMYLDNFIFLLYLLCNRNNPLSPDNLLHLPVSVSCAISSVNGRMSMRTVEGYLKGICFNDLRFLRFFAARFQGACAMSPSGPLDYFLESWYVVGRNWHGGSSEIV